eukprot:jgi/Botrbrau1/16129/Bobra.7_2s0088.1
MKKALSAVCTATSPSSILVNAEANVLLAYQVAGAVTGVVEGCMLALTNALQRRSYTVHSCGKDKVAHDTLSGGLVVPKNVTGTLLPLVIVGDEGVGKTTVVYRLLGRTEVPRRTLGGDLHFIHRHHVDGRSLLLQVWETGGRPSAKLLGPGFFQQACGALVLFDATVSSAAESLDWWSAFFRDQENPHGPVPIVALGVVKEDGYLQYCQGTLPGWEAAVAWCKAKGDLSCFLLPPAFPCQTSPGGGNAAVKSLQAATGTAGKGPQESALWDAVVGEAFQCLLQQAVMVDDARPRQQQSMTEREAEIADCLTFHAFDPASLAFLPVAFPKQPLSQPSAPTDLLPSANGQPSSELPVTRAPKTAASAGSPGYWCIPAGTAVNVASS